MIIKCETCVHNDCCKYKEDYKKTVNDIESYMRDDTSKASSPFRVELTCLHFYDKSLTCANNFRSIY